MSTQTLIAATHFTIASQATGRTYWISVHRPVASPAAGPTEDCPILFMLDGDLTFGTAVESLALRAAFGQLQPAIIVGVTYEMDLLSIVRQRTKDLTPPAPEGMYADMAAMIGTEYGGADAFLAFLIDELAPAIRARAPEASGNRLSIFGHSLGGLFVLYALMKRPESFECFLANSPSLWWNGFSVLAQRDSALRKIAGLSPRPRVHIGVGALEQEEPTESVQGVDLEAVRRRVREARMVDAAREFAESLRAAELPELKFVAFDDEDHSSVVPAAIGRAVTFALRKS
jgi:predicted alpha/beta superfamily hydrolase